MVTRAKASVFMSFLNGFIVLFGSMAGMILYRNLLLKFFLCYETFFFTISVLMLLSSGEIVNSMILILFLL